MIFVVIPGLLLHVLPSDTLICVQNSCPYLFQPVAVAAMKLKFSNQEAVPQIDLLLSPFKGVAEKLSVSQIL